MARVRHRLAGGFIANPANRGGAVEVESINFIRDTVIIGVESRVEMHTRNSALEEISLIAAANPAGPGLGHEPALARCVMDPFSEQHVGLGVASEEFAHSQAT